MTAFNGYPISVFLAVLLHGVVLGTLLLFQQAESESLDLVRPQAVKALLVSENPQARNERVQQQQVQQQREREQQEQAARQQREQAQQERERQEQLRQEQQAQEQARQTQLRQEREREEQARAERQREEQRREEEARRLEQERLEQQRQQEAERQRQEEQARADAAAGEAAETEAEITMAYTSVIHDLVQRNWSRPPSARNDMTAVLRIRLVPTGDVVDVEIVRSSGDAAFDRAAENAVRAVGRFTELQGMPPRMFERSFRSLLLTFRPEDLLN
ncbi:MAG: energy transducer TonB [Pseudohongiella sp.]|uniref:energy transducer TonB n=1 Tax=Pseudohongiella sp. TaxID=1979412 RepID=UPI0034A08D98